MPDAKSLPRAPTTPFSFVRVICNEPYGTNFPTTVHRAPDNRMKTESRDDNHATCTHKMQLRRHECTTSSSVGLPADAIVHIGRFFLILLFLREMEQKNVIILA